MGTAQLTANGTATLKFRPGVGNHSYKAVLAEPASFGPSASAASSLTVTASTVTGQLATTTYIESSGVPNVFSLTAAVPGDGNALPTGMVSFLDTSNGNAVLGTAALTTETGSGFADSSLLPVASKNTGNTILTADFNGDGIADLVILGNGISVLLGNGDGTFTGTPNPPSNGSPGAIAVGDFNGDGIPDLAVTTDVGYGDDGFSVGDSELFFGKGDGTFTPGVVNFENADGVVTANSIVSGDFNGDGKLDLVEATQTIGSDQFFGAPSSDFLIVFGNGDGTFTVGSEFGSVPPPSPAIQSAAMAVGDFNGDGHLDLAVTNPNLTILLGDGEGNFKATAANPATGDNPSSIAVADFNGDGDLDLAVTDSGSNNVTILLGNGDGTFTTAASPAAGMAPTSVAVGDFNGDGVPDLAVANAGSSNVTILLGNGDGTFAAAPSPVADTGSTTVAVADFNGDGKQDIVVANSADGSATALLAETGLGIATVNNISPVGVGIHLVQAVYSGDANYGGSTSTDASLIVVPPGFSITGTPVTIASSGASATSTIAVTPTNGFSGSVTLECVGGSVPPGANVSDAPTCMSTTVTISGNAPATTMLGIQTQPGTSPGRYQESVTAIDSSGVVMASTSVAVTVNAPPPGFALTNTPVSIASPGPSGISTITVTPSGGFAGTVTLSCAVTGPAGAIDAPGCSIAAPVSITSTSAVTATLTVNTTAASAVSTPTSNNIARGNPLLRILPLGGATMAALLFLAPPVFCRRWNLWLGLLLFAVVAGAAIGCGGAMKTAPPASTNPGTTAGSYTVKVTGVGGATMATTAVTVTVI